ncbi:MAG: MBL fold metallo-hydrolase [Caldilineaceae bacterium]|nr:MBL fold metallo-hydrolase [Caldilineaceae bacterium]
MIHIHQHGSVTAIRMARTFLGRPLYWTTAYWLDGLLIDSGPARLAHELVRVIGDLPIEQIVLTHGHEDHIGGLHHLRQQFPNVRIYAAPQTIPFIQDPDLLYLQLYRRFLWGTPKAVEQVEPLPLHIETSQFTLRIVETPGHSRDHVSFFEPKYRWLFSGDAFIGGKDRSWAREYEMFGVISSLRTLASLRPERIFPGSGNVRRSALNELHGKIGQLLTLCQEVARLDGMGLPTAQIVDRLVDGESAMRFWTGGHFSGAHLIQACRRYNELFDLTQPVDDVQILSASQIDDDDADPSTSESADQGDWRSTK